MKTISVVEKYQIKAEGDCRDCSCNAILEVRTGFQVKMLCYPFKSIVLDYKPCKACLKRRKENQDKIVEIIS